MSDFAISYKLCRGRFNAMIERMSQAQLNFSPYPGVRTCGEFSVHLAAVEASFIHQGLGLKVPADKEKLLRCTREGVISDGPFPYTPDELTPELVKTTLDWSQGLVMSVIEEPSEEFLNAQIETALGPMASGRDCLARIAFHPAYHNGQAYLISLAPNFPKG